MLREEQPKPFGPHGVATYGHGRRLREERGEAMEKHKEHHG
jgi:hypothetical protein